MRTVIRAATILSYKLNDDGQFPNSIYPVLFYKNVLDIPFFRPATHIEDLFLQNRWYNSWRSGIFTYHHYHSNTHEVMGMYEGKTTLLLGGLNGIELEIEKGDVLILPAGTAHKNLEEEHSIKCVGAYPSGKEYDMKYGHSNERPGADDDIRKVSVNINDPVFGKYNGIPDYWKPIELVNFQ